MRFVIGLYRKQVQEGRVFLLEHPKNAKSWMMEEVKRLASKEGVSIVESDQCMFGLTTWGGQQVEASPREEAYEVHGESKAIGVELNKRCDGRHQHQSLVDGERQPRPGTQKSSAKPSAGV